MLCDGVYLLIAQHGRVYRRPSGSAVMKTLMSLKTPQFCSNLGHSNTISCMTPIQDDKLLCGHTKGNVTLHLIKADIQPIHTWEFLSNGQIIRIEIEPTKKESFAAVDDRSHIHIVEINNKDSCAVRTYSLQHDSNSAQPSLIEKNTWMARQGINCQRSYPETVNQQLSETDSIFWWSKKETCFLCCLASGCWSSSQVPLILLRLPEQYIPTKQFTECLMSFEMPQGLLIRA